jgi:hypothetical protein
LALNQGDCQPNFVKDFLELDGKRGKLALYPSGQKENPPLSRGAFGVRLSAIAGVSGAIVGDDVPKEQSTRES